MFGYINNIIHTTPKTGHIMEGIIYAGVALPPLVTRIIDWPHMSGLYYTAVAILAVIRLSQIVYHSIKPTVVNIKKWLNF